MTDYVIIGEGSIERHSIAIAREIMGALQNLGEVPICVEGLHTGDWVVMDYCGDYYVILGISQGNIL